MLSTFLQVDELHPGNSFNFICVYILACTGQHCLSLLEFLQSVSVNSELLILRHNCNKLYTETIRNDVQMPHSKEEEEGNILDLDFLDYMRKELQAKAG